MKRLPLVLWVLGTACLASVGTGAWPETSPAMQGADAENKPKVSVVSLMVLREVDGAAMHALTDSSSGDIKPGVMLVGRIALPAGNVISVDKTLRIEKFADDSGTDLGNGLVKARYSSDEPMQCYMSPDRRQCTFWLGSLKLPAPGSEKLLVDGSLNVQLGIGEKAVESQRLTLKLGQEYQSGDLKLKVSQISTQGAEGGLYVTFAGQTELPHLKAIDCTDEAGDAVAVQIIDRYERDRRPLAIRLTRPVKEMTLRVVQFEKIETVKIPVKLEVKVGL